MSNYNNKDQILDVKAEILSWVKLIIFAVLAAVFINNVVLLNAVVPTSSMENNIMPGDRLFAFRLAYVFTEPKRFDIAVFKFPDNEQIPFVKRIIGLPGETVDIIDGKVYINSSEVPLDDSFIKEPQWVTTDMHFDVPEGKYFMMGDNRNNSLDSRSWDENYVERDKIVGKVFVRYSPITKMRLF
ncbi:MAG: signal peptidase I [Clostridiales bacterium]|jgi:signal peptidase I|nr:signal peptidase I [Clostridiales bacterium]